MNTTTISIAIKDGTCDLEKISHDHILHAVNPALSEGARVMGIDTSNIPDPKYVPCVGEELSNEELGRLIREFWALAKKLDRANVNPVELLTFIHVRGNDVEHCALRGGNFGKLATSIGQQFYDAFREKAGLKP